MGKKASLTNWIWALVVIFIISIIYMVMHRPFVMVDDKLSPMINMTTNSGQDAQEVVNKVRMYWRIWPVLLIVTILLWAFFTSLKQDPNYPSGGLY